MAYSPITQVNIALQTSGLTAAGFGTPLFIADIDTAAKPNPLGAGVRVKSYTDITEVALDFATSDAAYIAAEQFFSPNPRPAVVKIAYRDTTATAVETPAEALAVATAEDPDFYFVTAQSHTAADVVAYATAVEATKRMYFTSSQEVTTLSAYDEGVSTDALAELKEGNFERSKGFFHHLADTAFPECYHVAYNAPFLAGSVSWTNLRVALPVSQDPATSKPLSTTQKGYLEDRNAAYTERLGANTVILRNGRTAGGVYIDLIRGRDSLEEDINVALQDLLVRQKGGKLPYTQVGVTAIYNTVENVLSRYAQNPRNFINEGFIMNFLPVNRVPTADLEARVYQSGTFSASVQGAIDSVIITGSLSVALG